MKDLLSRIIFKNSGCRYWATILLLLTACNSNSVSDESLDRIDPFPAFAEFPATLFYGINFGMTRTEAESELLVNGFNLTDSSGTKYFLNQQDSTEFILPEKETVSSFKVFLKAKPYLTMKRDLLDRFKASSVTFEDSELFSVFDYALPNKEFKLSVFSQADYLRLSFEEKKRK